MSEDIDYETGLKFRAINHDDQDFLRSVYASTRKEEMELLSDWSSQQKNEFLNQQFLAQHDHYQKHFCSASFQVISYDDVPIGRLYLDRRSDEIRIVDIALLPEYRGQGFGTYILKKIHLEAIKFHLPVRIHVEKNNPAMQLYDRLGYVAIEDKGVYLLMEYPLGALLKNAENESS